MQINFYEAAGLTREMERGGDVVVFRHTRSGCLVVIVNEPKALEAMGSTGLRKHFGWRMDEGWQVRPKLMISNGLVTDDEVVAILQVLQEELNSFGTKLKRVPSAVMNAARGFRGALKDLMPTRHELLKLAGGSLASASAGYALVIAANDLLGWTII